MTEWIDLLGKWQPIVTIPWGWNALLFFPDDDFTMSVGYFCPARKVWVTLPEQKVGHRVPTHWMRLPDAPNNFKEPGIIT